jgi:hypothetical protein
LWSITSEVCIQEEATALVNPNNLIEKILTPHIGESQFGVNKYSQIFEAVITCNRGFMQFVIKTRQVGFLEKEITLGPVDTEFCEVKSAPSTNSIYIPLK